MNDLLIFHFFIKESLFCGEILVVFDVLLMKLHLHNANSGHPLLWGCTLLELSRKGLYAPWQSFYLKFTQNADILLLNVFTKYLVTTKQFTKNKPVTNVAGVS